MRTGVPRLLWRLLLADSVRVLALTATALVVTIAFAASIKPLADGKIALADMLVLMSLLVIPMMQFALPFAAGFAATLAYHRFAADNESQAAQAAGISPWSLLVPAGGLGLIVALVLYALLTTIVPQFLREAEQLVRRDITRALVAPINRGQTISLEGAGLDVYAKGARVLDPPEGSGAVQYIVLRDVFAAERSGENSDGQAPVPTYISADRVELWVFNVPGEASTELQFVFDGVTSRSEEGELRTDRGLSRRFVVPGSFRDDPKFRSAAELRRAKQRPRMIQTIDRSAQRVAQSLADERTAAAIDDELRAEGHADFERFGDRYTLFGSGLEPAASGGEHTYDVLPSGNYGDVRLLWQPATGGDVIHAAASAALSVDRAESVTGPGELRIAIELNDVVNTAGDDTARGESLSELERLTRSGLTPRDALAGDTDETLPAADLIERARASGSPSIINAADRLERDVNDLQREILSKEHERYATPVASLFMIILAAASALRRPSLLPVPAYLFAFFPSLASVIVISTGQNLTHEYGPPGLALLWAGAFIPAIAMLIDLRAIAKH